MASVRNDSFSSYKVNTDLSSQPNASAIKEVTGLQEFKIGSSALIYLAREEELRPAWQFSLETKEVSYDLILLNGEIAQASSERFSDAKASFQVPVFERSYLDGAVKEFPIVYGLLRLMETRRRQML